MKLHTDRKFLIKATIDLRLAWAGLVFKTFIVVLILITLFLEHANAIVVDLTFVFCVLQGRERIFSRRAIDVEDPFKIVGWNNNVNDIYLNLFANTYIHRGWYVNIFLSHTHFKASTRLLTAASALIESLCGGTAIVQTDQWAKALWVGITVALVYTTFFQIRTASIMVSFIFVPRVRVTFCIARVLACSSFFIIVISKLLAWAFNSRYEYKYFISPTNPIKSNMVAIVIAHGQSPYLWTVKSLLT